jgi:cytidine deaminase
MYSELLSAAWEAREHSNPIKSGTRVGCAIMSPSRQIYTGWNIEGLWQTSIHAEVSAICKIKASDLSISLIAIVAAVERFTPCGACLDWIYQYATLDCIIITQNRIQTMVGPLVCERYSIKELMPFYPIR